MGVGGFVQSVNESRLGEVSLPRISPMRFVEWLYKLLELLTVVILLGVVQATAAVDVAKMGTASALISLGARGNVGSTLVEFLFDISREVTADEDDDGLAEVASLFRS